MNRCTELAGPLPSTEPADADRRPAQFRACRRSAGLLGALGGLVMVLAAPAALAQMPVASQMPAASQMAGAVNALFAAPPAPVVPPLAPAPAEATESLDALLARVLARDPQVRVAQSLLQATEQRRLQARSRLGPSLSLTFNEGRSQEVETVLGTVNRSTSRAEAGLRWNLYNAGNDMAELNGATRDVAAGEQDLRRAREEVAERIAEAYADLLRLQALLPHAQERLGAVRRLVEQVRQQNAAGRASDADATQASASQVDAEIVQDQMLSDLDAARRKLAALVGGEVRAAAPLALRVQPLDAAPPGTRDADITAVSGQVAGTRLRADAARDRVRPVASLWAPRIDLEVRQQLSDNTSPQLTTQQKQVVQVVARWDFPVLGEGAARRTEGQRRAEAAQAEAERLLQGAQVEMQTLGPRIASAERSLAQLEQQVAQYNVLVRAGEVQFEAGRRTVSQLIGLRDSRFNVEQRRSEQAQRLLASRLRLLSLQGRLLPALGLDALAP